MRLAPLFLCLAAIVLPAPTRAAGAHDRVGCSGCHGHKEIMAGNKVYADPETKQAYTGSTAVCFACHQTKEAGGNGNAPVWRHLSHPFGMATVNPKKARVPADMLVNGRVECMSCHDPHPANSNYKYLRADVGPSGLKMDRFCAMCHPAKADRGT